MDHRRKCPPFLPMNQVSQPPRRWCTKSVSGNFPVFMKSGFLKSGVKIKKAVHFIHEGGVLWYSQSCKAILTKKCIQYVFTPTVRAIKIPIDRISHCPSNVQRGSDRQKKTSYFLQNMVSCFFFYIA